MINKEFVNLILDLKDNKHCPRTRQTLFHWDLPVSLTLTDPTDTSQLIVRGTRPVDFFNEDFQLGFHKVK